MVDQFLGHHGDGDKSSVTGRHGDTSFRTSALKTRPHLNRLEGVFSRPAHKLFGQSYVDRVLVLDTAKGGVATAWMLHEMRSRNMVSAAIVFNTVNTILAQGAALGDVTMIAGFDVDITVQVPHGAMVEIDPESRTLRILDADEVAPSPAFAPGLRTVHGPTGR